MLVLCCLFSVALVCRTRCRTCLRGTLTRETILTHKNVINHAYQSTQLIAYNAYFILYYNRKEYENQIQLHGRMKRTEKTGKLRDQIHIILSLSENVKIN